MTTWHIIADANSFYASVEKVFRPELRSKPVAVLSSNDGIIVALSPEAKAAGFKRGDAYHLIKKEAEKAGLVCFSSNFVLYYDFSRRIESVLKRSFVNVEKYSIDESFITFRTELSIADLRTLLLTVRTEILTQTKIAVSFGAAQSKTLAKVMNKYAKQEKRYGGVAILQSKELIEKALKNFPVEDVWGIGRQSTKKLHEVGITNAWQYIQKPDSWIRKNFNVTGLRTAKELRGETMIQIGDVTESKQSILCSRSFGKALSDYGDLRAALADFVEEVAEKMRKQQSVCRNISVFLVKAPPPNRIYGDSEWIQLEMPYYANDNITMTQTALIGLSHIFKNGTKYKKAGVTVSNFIPEANIQFSLWENTQRMLKYRALYKKIDFLNSTKGYIYLGVQTPGKPAHALKNDWRSPEYTTDIDRVPIIDMDKRLDENNKISAKTPDKE